LETARKEQVTLCQQFNTTKIEALPKHKKNADGDKADPEAFLTQVIPPALPAAINLIPKMNSTAVDKIQKLLGKMHNILAFRAAWRAIETDDLPRRTQFLANTVPTSNLWLRNIPSNPKFKMDPFSFRFNLLQHFCMDAEINKLLGVHEQGLHCCCNKDISAPPGKVSPTLRPATYSHFVNCTRQSAFTARHNQIVRVCADATRAAGLNPQLEAMVSRPAFSASASDNQSSQKRFDVTVAGADELLVLHLDISVTSTRQQDEPLAIGGARHALHVAKHKAQEKMRKYKDTFFVDTETLLPMVAETSGAIHPNFAKFFAAIGARVDNHPPLDAIWTTPTFASYWLALTSVTLRRETARACQRLADAALGITRDAGKTRSDKQSGHLDQ
jgi:hypothetical protein